ncbi:MAG: cell division protein FtsL [Betaproteobacteria bacterium]|nr:MAG: cell division protein FtsL [Betaproteobacteria bacterium]TAG46429.1 MAG: cell division protein FtsL [Betaproteobacteria bacterium]
MTKANVVIGVLLWISAFALISSQYRVRQLTIEINRARDLAYQLDNDRVRATLAQSKLSTPSRVESTARERLQMELPELSRSPIVDVRALPLAEPVAVVGKDSSKGARP